MKDEIKNNNIPRIGFNMGTSFMLVIFILICLVVFAVLSLVSATADYRMSKNIAEHTQDYYNATNQIQIELAHALDTPRNSDEIKDFTVNMGDNQQIHVIAHYPATGFDEKVKIMSWKVENTGELATDYSSLPVLSAE